MKLSKIVNSKKSQLIFLAAICIVAIFLRFYNISSVPPALYQDETSIGYNAYSILETGKDEHGKSFPLYFKSFGDQKLPVYFYLTAISEKVFGLNEFAVRFPSAVVGSLSVLILFLLVKEITKRSEIALLSSFLLALNPWHLHFSRAGFETNVALFFALLGSLFFILGVRRKNFLLMFLSVVSFVGSLYSYNLTRLLSPLLFSILVFTNWNVVKKIEKGKILILGFIGLILLSPFIYTFLSESGVSSAQGALITSKDIEAKIIEIRGYYLYLPDIFTKIFFNKYVYLFWTYANNLVGIFSSPFFFISGTMHGNQGIGNFGMFHVFEFPIILLGLYKVLKDKLREYFFFIFWGVAVVLILALSKEVPHATRGFFLVVPGVIFSALGISIVFKYLSGIKIKIVSYACFAIGLAIAFYSLVFYLTSYHQRFPILYAQSWRTADKDLSLYLLENEKNYERIIFDDSSGFMYSSLLFYQGYSPKEFQSTLIRDKDDLEGFSKVLSFGKYVFKKVDWGTDLSGNVLVITSSENKPNDTAVLKTFTYPLRPVALSIKEEIRQFAVEEPAYVLVEGK